MKRWKPKEGEVYYFFRMLPEIIINSYAWVDDDFDRDMYKSGNCFRTKKEATEKLEAIKKILKGKNDTKR
jgi:hypothetical protein